MHNYRLNLVSLLHKKHPRSALRLIKVSLSKQKSGAMRRCFADMKTITADKRLPVKLEVMNLISVNAPLRSEKVNGGRVAKNTTRLRQY